MSSLVLTRSQDAQKDSNTQAIQRTYEARYAECPQNSLAAPKPSIPPDIQTSQGTQRVPVTQNAQPASERPRLGEAQNTPQSADTPSHGVHCALTIQCAPPRPNAQDTQDTHSSPSDRADRIPALLSVFTGTVPRQYVHRAAHAEVFLTGHERTGEETYTLTGQWPRAHTFFTTADGRSHDHLQACETLRQAGIYLAHTEHHVPLDHHFVMQDMTVTSHPEHLTIQSTPTNLTLHATLTPTPRRRTFTIHLNISSNQQTLATGYGYFTCISPSAYQRVRAAPVPTPTLASLHHTPNHHQNPHAHGRNNPRDLVLAPTDQPYTWRLNANPNHPVLFDHDGDHIPGMVLIEAARQSSQPRLPANAVPIQTQTQFHRYVELTDPCYITTTPQPSTHPDTHTIRVTGHQNDRLVFTSHLTATTHPSLCPTAATRP
ncbi:ScbA/BarX family gamma-butyrolactone biosynthesis protein [Streptomyces sp. NPDC058284]|uniref:ScbA/BarX family gamma-butyrolactone biosynthesis protein n=1 Tax=unclassified Streptomyces TaxID=2593676 RepID=UPI003657F88F